MKAVERIALIINNYIDNEETSEEIAVEILEFIRSKNIDYIIQD